jgi:hypothetical protein
MATSNRLPVFEKFIHDLRAAWAELPDTEARMKPAFVPSVRKTGLVLFFNFIAGNYT